MKRGIKITRKKAQVELSFGMIFSIILIIAFLVVAFYAIKKFIDFRDKAQIETFIDDLNSAIYKTWNSDQVSSKNVEYILPKKIESVCFTNKETKNFYLKLKNYVDRREIVHINIEKITYDEDPYCIENKNGKVKMILKKDSKESSVTITR